MHKHIVELTGTLTAQTALHLGNGQRGEVEGLTRKTASGKEESVQVAEILRDENNLPYLPATSLKGALRARYGGEAGAELFGHISGADDRGGTMGRLWIYGAICRSSPSPTPPSARTRIDRASGTADDHKLFHMEMVPQGTKFAFRAIWLTDASGEALTAELAHVATALAPLTSGNGITLGRGGRQGQGLVRLADLQAVLKPWNGTPRPVKLPKVDWRAAGEITNLRLHGDGPFMIHDPRATPSKTCARQDDADTNILRALRDSKDQPLLPGSSLMGALRARAAWLDHGADDRDRVYNPDTPLTPTEELFGVTGWRGLLTVDAIEVKKPGKAQCFMSVKIDRFSGAPIDGALFGMEGFVDPEFDVTLRLAPRGNAPSDGARTLFDRLIQDIAAMGLTLGHGAARGFGWFTVEHRQ